MKSKSFDPARRRDFLLVLDPGDDVIGSLTAFLTYLVQILMSVMMATFLLMLAPRAIVCARRIQEVLQTEPSVVPPERGIATTSGPAAVEVGEVVAGQGGVV